MKNNTGHFGEDKSSSGRTKKKGDNSTGQEVKANTQKRGNNTTGLNRDGQLI